MDAYQLLIEQTGGGAQRRVDIGANRTKAGTINALIVSYKSAAFTRCSPQTQRTRATSSNAFVPIPVTSAQRLYSGHHKILEKRSGTRNGTGSDYKGPDGVRHRGRDTSRQPVLGVEPKAPKAWGT